MLDSGVFNAVLPRLPMTNNKSQATVGATRKMLFRQAYAVAKHSVATTLG